jgi:hypothetical protein
MIFGIFATGSGYIRLDSTAKWLKVSFKAWADLSITEIRFYCSYRLGFPYYFVEV